MVLLRLLSTLCFAGAICSVAALIFSDSTHHLQFSSLHQRTGALPLIFIGGSYIFLQMTGIRLWSERIKGLLLGLAFVMWGGEQLLPASIWVTMMDSAVITIFVGDLGLIILGHLKQNDTQLP